MKLAALALGGLSALSGCSKLITGSSSDTLAVQRFVASPGDILVGGRNFGMGSSRPAARSLRNLKLACLVAESINGLFLRNSVNFGFPALECRGIGAAFEEGDVAEVSFDDYKVRNQRTGAVLDAEPLPETLRRLMQAGGLFPLLESEGYLAPRTG